jgi:hypothetical protein
MRARLIQDGHEDAVTNINRFFALRMAAFQREMMLSIFKSSFYPTYQAIFTETVTTGKLTAKEKRP